MQIASEPLFNPVQETTMPISDDPSYQYNMTIKMFSSEPEPSFEAPQEVTRVRGRNWGVDNDVGQIRNALLYGAGVIHQPQFRLREKHWLGHLRPWEKRPVQQANPCGLIRPAAACYQAISKSVGKSSNFSLLANLRFFRSSLEPKQLFSKITL